MNTLLSLEAISEVWYMAIETPDKDMNNIWKESERKRQLAKSQDAHTRSELAKAVRKIENPYNPDLPYDGFRYEGFESMRKAVLKLLESRENHNDYLETAFLHTL